MALKKQEETRNWRKKRDFSLSPRCCALLGFYATKTCDFVPTFRDNLLVPYSFVK